MKKELATIVTIGLLVAGTANADLTVIGTASFDGGISNYNLIYDDDAPLGPITWLDYTNGIDTWSNQMSWASGLNGTLTYNLNTDVASWSGGDWRLPSAGTAPAAGYDQTSSEMGHLYYEELGLDSYPDRGYVPVTAAELNATDFDHLVAARYWSGTEYANYTARAWWFNFEIGSQSHFYKDMESSRFYALAVRPGEVSFVPAPAAVLLAGIGLSTSLAGLRLRRSGKKSA